MSLIPQSLRQRPVSTVLGFCLLLLFTLVIWNLARSQDDSRLTAIRQAGYPVTLAELNEYYPAVPDELNAALVYGQVFQMEALTNGVIESLLSHSNLARGEPLPEGARGALAEVFAANSPAWQLLYSATNRPACRYPVDMRDGLMVLLPHLAKIRQATTLLSLEGFAHASAGHSEEAYAAFNAAFHVADSVRDEPILISFLVRIACSTLIARRLEQSLNLMAFDEDQLCSLQERFAAAGDSRWAARALAGERAFGLSFFIDRHIQRIITGPQQGLAPVPTGLGGRLAIAAYRASGLMAKDQDFYLEAMDKSIKLAELPTDKRIKAGPPPSMTSSNRFRVLSRMILPALQRALDRAAEHSARMRVIETALGVERFRLAHAGALPQSLEQLAPQYLRKTPLDPFDSQPLRYKKLPHGYVVYSIGPDQKDDGGAEPPSPNTSRTRTTSTPTDLTFVVERE